jgi:hypothetical protein
MCAPTFPAARCAPSWRWTAAVGNAKVDATAQLIRGMVDNDSPLRLTANANLGSLAWVSPLLGQPGLEVDGALRWPSPAAARSARRR